MENLGKAKLSSDYVQRHKVSVRLLDRFIAFGVEDATNPGLSPEEMEEVAYDVATRWDNVDGQLANYSHFVTAVSRRALRALSKKKTSVITVRSVSERVSGSVKNALESGPDADEIDEKYSRPYNDR